MKLTHQYLYSQNVNELLIQHVKVEHNLNYTKYMNFLREVLFKRRLTKTIEIDRFFTFYGSDDFIPLYDFLENEILSKFPQEILFIVAKINYLKCWKSYIPSDEEIKLVLSANITPDTLRIYCNIIATLADKVKYTYRFTQNFLPIMAIMQSLYNLVTISYFNEESKSLPF